MGLRSMSVPVPFHPYTMWNTSELWKHHNENFFPIFPDGALGGGPCPFQSHFILIQCGIHLSYEHILMRIFFLFFQKEHGVEVHDRVAFACTFLSDSKVRQGLWWVILQWFPLAYLSLPCLVYNPQCVQALLSVILPFVPRQRILKRNKHMNVDKSS